MAIFSKKSRPVNQTVHQTLNHVNRTVHQTLNHVNRTVHGFSTHKAGYPDSQLSEHSATQPETQELEKLAKRDFPDYTQTTFRIPKKLSRQISLALMDLADEGVEMVRSDLLEELAGAFIRLADEVGAVEALEQFKNLGTQVDE